MSEFNIKSESVDVERIMEQIRTRIKEKRGEDYTEAQVRELANVKLERFLDPKKVRSDLVEHYRRKSPKRETLAFPESLRQPPPEPPSFEFDPDIIYRSSRGLPGRLLYGIRRLLNPILKFFFNPAPIVHALHVQREINERQHEAISWMVQTQAEFIDRIVKLFDMSSSRLAAREEIDALNYEVLNNLVVEMTRLSIEMKNHRMRVESIAGRLDFDERRARALETVVEYRDAAAAAGRAQGGGEGAGDPERRRRRRRRGRRRPSTGGEANPEAAASPADQTTGETTAPETAAPVSSAGQAVEQPETRPSSAPAGDSHGDTHPEPLPSGSVPGSAARASSAGEQTPPHSSDAPAPDVPPADDPSKP